MLYTEIIAVCSEIHTKHINTLCGQNVELYIYIYIYIYISSPYRAVNTLHLGYKNQSINLLAPKFYIWILAHPVWKMWITQEPKKVALWNKRHFEEKNGVCAACFKYSVLIFVEKIYKMQHLEGSRTPVLYIGRKVLKG